MLVRDHRFHRALTIVTYTHSRFQYGNSNQNFINIQTARTNLKIQNKFYAFYKYLVVFLFLNMYSYRKRERERETNE